MPFYIEHARRATNPNRLRVMVILREGGSVHAEARSKCYQTLIREADLESAIVWTGLQFYATLRDNFAGASQLERRLVNHSAEYLDPDFDRLFGSHFLRYVDRLDPGVSCGSHGSRHSEDAHALLLGEPERCGEIPHRLVAIGEQHQTFEGMRCKVLKRPPECLLEVGGALDDLRNLSRTCAGLASGHRERSDFLRHFHDDRLRREGHVARMLRRALLARLSHPPYRGVNEGGGHAARDVEHVDHRRPRAGAIPNRAHDRESQEHDDRGAHESGKPQMPGRKSGCGPAPDPPHEGDRQHEEEGPIVGEAEAHVGSSRRQPSYLILQVAQSPIVGFSGFS